MRRRLLEENEGENIKNIQKTGDVVDDSDEEVKVAGDANAEELKEEVDDESSDDEAVEESDEEQTPEDTERGEFVLAGAQQEVAADEEKRGDSSEDHDDDEILPDDREENGDEPHIERDFSSYDTWMGILSTKNPYFVRIVKSSEVGVVSIDLKNN
jgi:hypothetical protein